MKERPILFSGQMVRALLSGAKTQTRRVVKPRADRDMGPRCVLQPHELAGEVNGGNYRNSPYGAPGDRLWVKEQTIKVEDSGWIGPVYTESDAGRQALEWGHGDPDDPDHIPPHAIKRRPSLFMTRAMSRITLEITTVRVERLQDISKADAIAEGCTAKLAEQSPALDDAWQDFRTLWESINGAGSWDANPWVWVVSFKRVEADRA